jgi:hypothetical protein
MRIIATQKDYYDCIQGHGQDQSLLYIRREKLERLSKWPFPSVQGNNLYGSNRYVQHVIGFCGKIYPTIEIHAITAHSIYDDRVPPMTLATNVEHVDEYMKTELKEKEFDAWMNDFPHGARWRGWGVKRSDFINFFDQMIRQQDKFAEMFCAERCPVFVASDFGNHQTIRYNATLEQYHFQRTFDPYRAYQEIAMFLGNMGSPDRPMNKMTNDEDAARLGHGGKYSFRKAPTKKR